MSSENAPTDTPVELLVLPDCGCCQRTIESARACKCDACTRWWCGNVTGYFYCPECHQAVTPLSDQYDGVCEQCFDARDDDAE